MSNKVYDYLFKKSKNKKGFIYLCECKTGFFWRKANEDTYHPEIEWKYGKTINLQNRMKLYGENYTLLNKWEVDHLSLREELIRTDWSITEDRESFDKDGRDEHVSFDCFDIVQYYATAELSMRYERNIFDGELMEWIVVKGTKEKPHFFTTSEHDGSLLLKTIRM